MRRTLKHITEAIAAHAQEFGRRWCEFWFNPQDPTTLGLIRILTGLMLVYTHTVWGLRLHDFFGPDGWIGPRLRELQSDQFVFSYLWYVSPDWLGFVHWIALIVLVMFTLGLFSQITSILSFVILINYAHRAPMALFGLDQINALLTLYLAVGPSGATLSIDRLIVRYRTTRQQISEQGADSVTLIRKPCFRTNVAIRLIQVHMCVLYLFAGLSKLFGEAWWSGEAIWRAAANYEYQSGDLTWLAYVPYLADVLTHVTAFWELSYCALIWPRLTRPLVLAGAVLMHLGIAMFMGMQTFGLIMIVANISFVSPLLLRRLLEALLSSRRELVVIYDGACGLCVRAVAWLKAFDVTNTLRLVDFNRVEPATIHASLSFDQCLGAMQVVESGSSDGGLFSGYWGVRRISRELRLLWPVAWLLAMPGASAAGVRLYRAVAANRSRRLGCTSGCAVHVPGGVRERGRAPLQLTVKVPPDALLFVQNQPVPGRGDRRRFKSKPARYGKDYVFSVRVEIERDGTIVTMSQQVRLRAGEHVVVEFHLAPSVAASDSWTALPPSAASPSALAVAPSPATVSTSAPSADMTGPTDEPRQSVEPPETAAPQNGNGTTNVYDSDATVETHKPVDPEEYQRESSHHEPVGIGN